VAYSPKSYRTRQELGVWAKRDENTRLGRVALIDLEVLRFNCWPGPLQIVLDNMTAHGSPKADLKDPKMASVTLMMALPHHGVEGGTEGKAQGVPHSDVRLAPAAVSLESPEQLW
jgi:hypothetical protein